MIKKLQDRKETTAENLVGGEGIVHLSHIFTQDELPRTRTCAILTLEPGCSLGQHRHENESELYVIVEGSATVYDDGVPHILSAGDGEYCPDGHTHGIVNHTDKPMKFLAVVIL